MFLRIKSYADSVRSMNDKSYSGEKISSLQDVPHFLRSDDLYGGHGAWRSVGSCDGGGVSVD